MLTYKRRSVVYFLVGSVLVTNISRILSWLISPNLFADYLSVYNSTHASQQRNAELYMTVPDIIRRKAYPVEEHRTITEDGYILALHRIPKSPKNTRPRFSKRPVVLVMHGLVGSSAEFTVNGNLAYMLSDGGYDVWMGNFRGTTYSKRHSRLSLNDREYWNFNGNHLANYDMPAIVDYVMEHTNASKIFYIGHSLGSVMPVAAITNRIDYNDKIEAAFLMAPVGTLKHLPFSVKVMTNLLNVFKWITDVTNTHVFFSNNLFSRVMSDSFCHQESLTHDLCKYALSVAGDVRYEQLDPSIIPSIFAHYGGVSVQLLTQLQQMAYSVRPSQFNYGEEENLKIYGQATPPEYQFENITIPSFVFVGEKDWLSSMEEIRELSKEAVNAVVNTVSISTFGHNDFLWSNDAGKLVYSRIIKEMDEMSRRRYR